MLHTYNYIIFFHYLKITLVSSAMRLFINVLRGLSQLILTKYNKWTTYCSLQARALHQNEKLSVIQFGLVKVNSKRTSKEGKTAPDTLASANSDSARIKILYKLSNENDMYSIPILRCTMYTYYNV